MSHEKSAGEGAPQASRVTEAQPGKRKRPTREERRQANRLRKAVAELTTQSRFEVPPGFSVRNGIVGDGAPQQLPVTVSQSAERENTKGKETRTVMGRPSEFTQEEGDTICAWIAAGGSLRKYSENSGRAVSTVYRWLREHADFRSQYAQAHEDCAQSLVDEGLEALRAAAVEPSIEGVQAARAIFDAIKWIAGKRHNVLFGDKQVVQHQGAVNIRIGIPARQPVELVEVVENRAALPGQQTP